MSANKQIEIGFSGGQVTSTRIGDDALADLRQALANGAGWHQVSSDDGDFVLNLSQVVFLKIAGEGQAIGFSGS